MKKNWISTLQRDLDTQQADWRAEVIAAELVDRGIPAENIVFYPEGTAKRAVSKDIVGVEHDTDGQEELLLIRTSREGLYDALPEGLFHQPYNSKPFKTKEELIREIQVHRQEEKEARKFFLPFENEFYQLRLISELKEKNTAHGFSSSNRLLFNSLYGDSSFFDKRQINLLLHLLPLAYTIRGNYTLTAQCFELLLDTQVAISEKQRNKNHTTEELHLSRLNHCALGVNSILGKAFDERHTILTFSIGPVPGNAVKAFLAGERKERVIKALIDFFIPAGMEVFTELIIQKSENDFFIQDEQKVSYLSYNSYI